MCDRYHHHHGYCADKQSRPRESSNVPNRAPLHGCRPSPGCSDWEPQVHSLLPGIMTAGLSGSIPLELVRKRGIPSPGLPSQHCTEERPRVISWPATGHRACPRLSLQPVAWLVGRPPTFFPSPGPAALSRSSHGGLTLYLPAEARCSSAQTTFFSDSSAALGERFKGKDF